MKAGKARLLCGLLCVMTLSAAVSAAAVSATGDRGQRLYLEHCGTCHLPDGSGVPMMQPALDGSERAGGPVGGVIEMILMGSSAVPPGESFFNAEMPAFDHLSDEDIASIATYVRTHFGNTGGPATAADVQRLRGASDTSRPGGASGRR
ncbi:c-type cytochrome [Eilatimonas milleporae]|uniref:c-type cytochrome n=1 Tax=Eilatimonas milleporae TaxID=911205 RepID=UPI000EF994DE|nr:cytochrome c [Eilatimonas milleporae]